MLILPFRERRFWSLSTCTNGQIVKDADVPKMSITVHNVACTDLDLKSTIPKGLIYLRLLSSNWDDLPSPTKTHLRPQFIFCNDFFSHMTIYCMLLTIHWDSSSIYWRFILPTKLLGPKAIMARRYSALRNQICRLGNRSMCTCSIV